jgi:enamine deaminase RidA (YjgF/YER057c/UK114 family)
VEQTRQALQNVLAILAEAGGEAHHITRMVWYVVNKQEYLGCGKELGKVYRDIMGKHYPVRHCQVIWHIENKAN